MNSAATGIAVVGIAAFFVAVVYVAISHVANVRNVKARLAYIAAWRAALPPQAVMARPEAVPHLTPIEPPIERPALPNQPLVIVFGDMYWRDSDMGEDMAQAMLKVARDYGQIGQEAVRELKAARRVVKGELAS